MRTELEQLREFYDPDTVELMHWIRLVVPPLGLVNCSTSLTFNSGTDHG